MQGMARRFKERSLEHTRLAKPSTARPLGAFTRPDDSAAHSLLEHDLPVYRTVLRAMRWPIKGRMYVPAVKPF